MSTRFWLFSASVAGMAVVTGLSLGAYATSQPSGRLPAPVIDQGFDQPLQTAAGFDLTDSPVQPIRCRGCGPTLAERRMAADLADVDADVGTYVNPAVESDWDVDAGPPSATATVRHEYRNDESQPSAPAPAQPMPTGWTAPEATAATTFAAADSQP